MSDLAPLVAAALKDKVVADLQEELEDVKAELQQNLNALSRMIRITGPGGTPVYAQRDYYERKRDDIDEGWHLDLISCIENSIGDGHSLPANPTLSMCNVEDIFKCELHIGTKEVIQLSSYEDSYSVSFPTYSNYVREHVISIMFPWEPSERHPQQYGDSIIFYFKTKLDALESEFPQGFFPEHYTNDQVEYVRFAYVSFCSHPFDDEESEANQEENEENNRD